MGVGVTGSLYTGISFLLNYFAISTYIFYWSDV